MEKLIRRYADFMLQSNYALATRKSYVGAVRNFYKWCLKQSANPDFDKADAHRQYLLYRARRGLSWQSINGDYSAIRLLYTKVLDREWDVDKLPRPRKEKTLPRILSTQEVQALIEAAPNFKHQFYIILLYATGLRLSESLNLQIEDISIDRKQLHVRRGKGLKDRYVLLPDSLLEMMKSYMNYYHPKKYLFNGKYRGSRWSNRAAQEAINVAVKNGQLPSSISAHGLRHSYATHHLENGTDVFTLQKQLGHKHLRTTAQYIHLCNKHYRQINHPIDDLCLKLKHIESDNSSATGERSL